MPSNPIFQPSSRNAWLIGGLVASFYPLLGLKRAFSIIGIGLAIYGVVALIRRGRSLWGNPAMRSILLVCLAFAIPLVFALPDAVFPMASLSATASSLLYMPILLAVALLVQEQNITRPLYIVLVITGAFWAFDALIQLMLGYDIFGVAYNGERVGAYWQNQFKFGYYMGFFGLFVVAAQAVLMPSRRSLLVLLWVLIAMSVLISGSREAWLMFFPFSGLLFWVHVARHSPHRWGILLGGIVLAMLIAALAFESSQTVRDRLTQSSAGLMWSYESIDAASSGRLELWRLATQLISEHIINGVGLDGYQKLFPSLVSDPKWVALQLKEGPYPHQYLLEVGAATGLIGWLGLLTIVAVTIRAWRQASPSSRAQAWPALIYLAALWFPLNTHRSFYSSELIMGNMIMLGLVLGSLLPKQAVLAPTR